ncbi:MAG: hypothetical protein ABIK89_20180, partial [Planctomycetota bacterium]
DWIHDAVVKEVVRNCLPADPATSPMEIAATPEKQPATTSKRQSAKTPKKQIADAPTKHPAATTEKSIVPPPKKLPAAIEAKEIAGPRNRVADAPGDKTGTSLTVPWPAFDVERRSIVSQIVK